MNNYDFIFLCLVRDCENTLDIFINFLKTFPKTKKIKVIFGENNSKDNTKDKIINYKSNSILEFQLLNLKKLSNISDRITRITKGRYLLQKYIIKKKYKSKYICIIDVDDVLLNCKCLTYNKFKKLVEKLSKNSHLLNGISVKSKPVYYDILAFKSNKINLPNILEIQRSKSFSKAYSLRKKYIFSIQKKINNMQNIFSISSFNGMCIYNFEDYIMGNYFYKEKYNIRKVKLNEHMKFNMSLNKKNGKFIFVDDKFFLNTPKEHLPPNNILSFWFIRLKNYLYKIL